MAGLLSSFMESIREDRAAGQEAFWTHIDAAKSNADSRVNEEASLERPAGYHRQQRYTNPDNSRVIRPFYRSTLHPELGYDGLEANGYRSALAVTKLLGEREF